MAAGYCNGSGLDAMEEWVGGDGLTQGRMQWKRGHMKASLGWM